MFKHLASALVLILVSGNPALAEDAIGFRKLTVPAAGEARALEVALWYPSDRNEAPILIADNRAFVGFEVAADAALPAGRHPLVVLSHGYGGNWNNQAWLAKLLVEQDYVVAAPNHPGTTTRDMNPADAAQLWKRPGDISHLIDALLADPAISSAIDPERIAMIGHSLGGWAAIEIAGGRSDAMRLEADCAAHPGLAACKVYRETGAGRDAASREALGRSLKEERVKAVVSLDLGLARGFDPASLARIDRPVLIIAAGSSIPGLPAELESGYLADHLPPDRTRHVQITDATHFSFLLVCKPGAETLLEEDSPGDGIICRDGGNRGRPEIHSEAAALVTTFLDEALGRK